MAKILDVDTSLFLCKTQFYFPTDSSVVKVAHKQILCHFKCCIAAVESLPLEQETGINSSGSLMFLLNHYV